MPNFKEFIKGFEEKPEAKNPNPAPTPKPQEVKMEEPKQQPKPQLKEAPKTKYEGGIAKDMQDAGFEPYGVDERKQILRVKDKQGADYEISQGEGYSYNVFKDGKKIYENVPNYMRFDTVVAGKPEEGFSRYQAKEAPKPQPKEGSFEKMMQGFEQPKMATEKKAEQYHEPKPKVEMDEDYERSWGPERKKDGYYKDDKGEIYLVEQGDTYYPVNEAERTEFFNAFNKQAKEAPKTEQPQQAPKQEAPPPKHRFPLISRTIPLRRAVTETTTTKTIAERNIGSALTKKPRKPRKTMFVISLTIKALAVSPTISKIGSTIMPLVRTLSVKCRKKKPTTTKAKGIEILPNGLETPIPTISNNIWSIPMV